MAEQATARTYRVAGECFKIALDGLNIEPAFAGAIKAMMVCPETIIKIRSFNATVWELVESCLNSNIIPVDDERESFFLAGVAHLEQI